MSTRESGFTLIEVIVSAMILAIISGSAATAIISAMHASGNDRIRAEAQALAEQNQDTLRGLNVDQLSNLNQTISKTLNGTQFSVQESATYVTDASGTPSCSNPSADYLKTTSTVSWTPMDGTPPVSASSLLTPTIGSVDPTHGTLAASVLNAAKTGVSGVNVSVSGPASASGQTAADGCVLFGDLPSGSTYTVSAWPASGTDVDGRTGQAVNSATPDTLTNWTVNAGSTASSSAPFSLDTPGSVSTSFTDAFPPGVTPAIAPIATAPGVIFSNLSMTTPSFRLCSAADQTCPVVGSGDKSFPFSAWQGANGAVTATPLFPYTYAAYAGVCTADEPYLYGGTDGSVTVTAGNPSTLKLSLPAMVVRLYSGQNTASSEIPVPTGASLVVTDTGCAMRYLGSTNPGAKTVSAGQAVLPLNSTYGAGASDTGLLTYPGMPWGKYSVCYTDPAGKVYVSAGFTNQGSGEIVNLFAGATTTGSCP